jgi:phage baseplate assembly protein W
MKSYNIKFPLNDDVNTNMFFMTNKTTKDAFSSDLLLLLLTQKGERYYEPDYGTDLLKFIFEPNDGRTTTDIEDEIKRTVSLYIPDLRITSVTFNQGTDDEGNPISDNQLNVNVKFVFDEDTFNSEGELTINF